MSGSNFVPTPVTGDIPTWDAPPDLAAGADGEYRNPSVGADNTWTTGELVDETEDSTFTITEVVHNRFQIDRGPEVTYWKAERVVPPDTRTIELGDDTCQTQERYVAKEYTATIMLVNAWVERWAIDEGLESYYSWLTGKTAKVGSAINTGAGLGAAKTMVGASVGVGSTPGAAATAAGAAAPATAAAATGIGVFMITTALMSEFSGSATLISAGWAPVGKFRSNERPTGNEQDEWVDAGEPFPCVKRPITGSPRRAQRVLIPSGAWLIPLIGLLAGAGLLWWWLGGSDSTEDAVDAGERVVDDDPGGLDEATTDPEPEPSPDAEPGPDSAVEDPPADPDPDPVVPEVSITKERDAASIGIGPSCGNVMHSPPPQWQASFSSFLLELLIFGMNGVIPPGSTLEAVILGADAPLSAPIDGNVASGTVPISSYGQYSLTDPVVVTPNGTRIPVLGNATVDVTAAEGPVGGCASPSSLTEDQQLAAIEVGRDELADAATLLTLGGFLDTMNTAHAGGDSALLLELLDPLVFDRYGADQCREYLAGAVGSVEDLVLLDGRPRPWDYETDGTTAEVPGAWEVDVEVTLSGERGEFAMHLHPTDSAITWFTDCGTPV